LSLERVEIVLACHSLCRPPHIDSGSGRVRSFGDAEVDADTPTVDLLLAHGLLGGLGVLRGLEVDEGEAARTASLSRKEKS